MGTSAFLDADENKDSYEGGALLTELEGLEAELSRRSLRFFVEKVWDIVEPEHPFVGNWHIDELCQVLEAVSRGEIMRLLVNVSPGSMKSLLVSVFWPAWEWGQIPQLRYLTASHGAHLSVRDNMRLRDVITNPWYMRHFTLRLSGDQNAKQLFHSKERGWRFATSVGGAGTGEHPDRIIIDDPHTAEQARSDAERQRALDWFDRTISSRGVVRDTRIIVIMQRLHENDLSGHLLKKGGWEHIMWPMRFDPARKDPRDPRTEAGELFWPHQFTEEKVRRLEIDLGQYGTAGQLQQRPAPEGGGLFKRVWFEIVDEVPALARRCRGWDTAATADGGDWTVGVRMSRTPEGIFYIEDVLRAQLSPANVERTIKLAAQMDGTGVRIREEQEPGSAGKSVIASRAKLLAGYDYRGVPLSGDKEARARAFRAQAEAGNVKLKSAPWNEAYLAELEIFPNGPHDDQVDGSSASFNELTLGPSPVKQRTVAWG